MTPNTTAPDSQISVPVRLVVSQFQRAATSIAALTAAANAATTLVWSLPAMLSIARTRRLIVRLPSVE
jgi:hypothetical protein